MFATQDQIKAHIIDVINAAPSGDFSPFIDVSDRADKRRSQDAVDSAATIASREVIEAVASNISHPYWVQLRDLATHQNKSVITIHYGEIGIPLIKPTASSQKYLTGIPKSVDEIEGILYGPETEPSDFYGFPRSVGGQTYDANLTANGRNRPHLLWYSTTDGEIQFTGASCKIPMIVKPEDPTDEAEFVREHVPINLIWTVVKRAVPQLVKEGDNLFQLSAWLNQQGMADLIEIKGGALKVAPLNLNQMVQLSQRAQV